MVIICQSTWDSKLQWQTDHQFSFFSCRIFSFFLAEKSLRPTVSFGSLVLKLWVTYLHSTSVLPTQGPSWSQQFQGNFLVLQKIMFLRHFQACAYNERRNPHPLAFVTWKEDLDWLFSMRENWKKRLFLFRTAVFHRSLSNQWEWTEWKRLRSSPMSMKQ